MKTSKLFIFIAATIVLSVIALSFTSGAGASQASDQTPSSLSNVVLPTEQPIKVDSTKLSINYRESGPASDYSLKGYDQYKCLRFSTNLDECLDGPNHNIVEPWVFKFIPIPAEVDLITRDHGDRSFEFQVGGNVYSAAYNSCIVVDVSVEQVWQGYTYYGHEKFTACFNKGIWYFRYHR